MEGNASLAASTAAVLPDLIQGFNARPPTFADWGSCEQAAISEYLERCRGLAASLKPDVAVDFLEKAAEKATGGYFAYGRPALMGWCARIENFPHMLWLSLRGENDDLKSPKQVAELLAKQPDGGAKAYHRLRSLWGIVSSHRAATPADEAMWQTLFRIALAPKPAGLGMSTAELSKCTPEQLITWINLTRPDDDGPPDMDVVRKQRMEAAHKVFDDLRAEKDLTIAQFKALPVAEIEKLVCDKTGVPKIDTKFTEKALSEYAIEPPKPSNSSP